MRKDFEDLTGNQYNMLTVQGYEQVRRNKEGWLLTDWICLCDPELGGCGNLIRSMAPRLKGNITKSCSDCAKKRQRAMPKGGHTKRAGYNTYRCMMNRCHNPKHDKYPHYGGRGIEVCPEWQNDRGLFLDWYDKAIEGLTEPNLRVDRIDNDKGYYPENCRIITNSENCRNKTNNLLVTYNGETASLAEIVEKYSTNSYILVHGRFHKQSWDLERALKEPPEIRAPRKKKA